MLSVAAVACAGVLLAVAKYLTLLLCLHCVYDVTHHNSQLQCMAADSYYGWYGQHGVR
jgi:hypothetical protein